jgi:hypothetical protein
MVTILLVGWYIFNGIQMIDYQMPVTKAKWTIQILVYSSIQIPSVGRKR